jgi:methionine-rich copper-binding protein CopC
VTFRLLNPLLAGLLIGLLLPVTVLAHAHLEESDPADGDTITTPYTLTARFSEEFDPDRSFIRVHDSTGDRVAIGAVSDDDPTVMIVELSELEPGEYEVRWQTVTPDDNGVENDTFRFTVAAVATPSPSAQATPSSSAVPTSSAPDASATPSASPATTPSVTSSPEPVDGSPSARGSDLVLALVLAAVAIGAVLLFIFARNRR